MPHLQPPGPARPVLDSEKPGVSGAARPRSNPLLPAAPPAPESPAPVRDLGPAQALVLGIWEAAPAVWETPQKGWDGTPAGSAESGEQCLESQMGRR